MGRAAPDQRPSPARRSAGHRYVIAQAGELGFERVVFFSDAVPGLHPGRAREPPARRVPVGLILLMRQVLRRRVQAALDEMDTATGLPHLVMESSPDRW